MLAQFLCISTTEHTLKAPASNAANKVTVSTNYHMKKQQEVSINNDVMVFMIEWLLGLRGGPRLYLIKMENCIE